MIEFKMPALGADMDEGTLNEWLVKPGDKVTRGQIVAVVETTKAAVEIECWQEGTVGELLVPVGETVQVGTTLATLLAEGERAEKRKKQRAPVSDEKPAAAPATAPVAVPAAGAPQHRRWVSPAARRTGSGPRPRSGRFAAAPPAPGASHTASGPRRCTPARWGRRGRRTRPPPLAR